MTKMNTLRERFFSKVTKTSGCWGWTGATSHGYGYIYVGPENAPNRVWNAQRVSWLLHFGEFDRSLCVLHKCDNPPCTNPKHLFLGTQQDNLADMGNKGRRKGLSRSGTANPRAKITHEDAKLIRHLYFAERRTQLEIAPLFGICNAQVSKIIRGKLWTRSYE